MRPRISIRDCVPWSVGPSVGRSITRFFRFGLSQLWATLGNSGQLWATLDNSGQLWATLGRIYWSTLGLVLMKKSTCSLHNNRMQNTYMTLMGDNKCLIIHFLVRSHRFARYLASRLGLCPVLPEDSHLKQVKL